VAAVMAQAAGSVAELHLPTFAEAVDLHKSMVFSIAWHFLRDRSLAEELAQDVFLELHRRWGTLRSADHMVFWLRKVTSNRAIDVIRKRRTRPETSLEAAAEPTTLEQMHDSLLASYLERMVATLPEKQRLAVVMRYQEDLEPEEIARVLGMNVSTVKTNLSRALGFLKTKTVGRLKPDAPNENMARPASEVTEETGK
jgi:RNA polymerase sigma-70 factor, ECF subfamily